MTVICDYSFARPDPAAIRAAGYEGVARYLDYLPNRKVIDRAELDALQAAGLAVTLVWEDIAQRASEGAPAGRADATETLRQLANLGLPGTTFVWYVAEDPTRIPQSDWPQVEAYFAAVCATLPNGHAQVGAYGSQTLVEHLVGCGLATAGWQVENWSTGVSGACWLYQRDTPTIAPPSLAGSIDEDAVLGPCWGQIGAQPAPTPPPTPAPPAPQPAPTGGDMATTQTVISTDNNGDGWCHNPTPGAVVDAHVIGEVDPPVGGYATQVPEFKYQDADGDLIFEGGPTGSGQHDWTVQIAYTV